MRGAGSPKGAIAFANCETSSRADFSQPLGADEKSSGAEHPPSSTKTKTTQSGGFCFSNTSGVFNEYAVLHIHNSIGAGGKLRIVSYYDHAAIRFVGKFYQNIHNLLAVCFV